MIKSKKKQGSTLVIVLGVAMVCLTLGSAIITSIMGTIKANISQKEREDLRYAAEGGLEIAKGHFKEGNATIDTRSTPTDNTKVEVLKGGIVDSVEVYLEGDKVKSVAKHVNGSSEEIIMAKYKKTEGKGNTTSIFDHGIVAGKGGVTVDSEGSMNGETSSISSGNGVNIEGKPLIGSIEENDIKNVTFKNWSAPEKEIVIKKDSSVDTDGYNIQEHDFYLKDENGKLKEILVTKVKMNIGSKYDSYTQQWVPGTLKVVGSDENPFDYLKKLEKQPVVVIEIAGVNDHRAFTIIMINSNELKIEINSSIQINNTAIINNGTVRVGEKNNVDDTSSIKGTMTLNNSTIFGEKVIIERNSSMHITEQPAKDKTGMGILLEKEEEIFNELIGSLLVDWNASNGSGTESSEGIEIEDNSFSN